MTRVKMCGMTRPEDARAAAKAGASAIGLVFWPGSPRAVTRVQARAIVAALPNGVPAVGVFVNQPADEINACIDAAGLFAVQLHGDEPVELIARLRRPVVRALTLARADEMASLPETVTVLLDAHDPARRGGTGTTIDWDAARTLAARRKIVLAGGLTPENVGDAIARVRPWAVDVSSGIETAPGVKDHARIEAFMAAARAADDRSTA